MAKTYIPKMVTTVHELRVYLARYGAVLRAAVAVVNPELVPLVDALITAVNAIDDARETLAPLGE